MFAEFIDSCKINSLDFSGSVIAAIGDNLKRIKSSSPPISFQHLTFLSQLEAGISRSTFNELLRANNLLEISTRNESGKPQKKRMKLSEPDPIYNPTDSEKKERYSNLMQSVLQLSFLASDFVKWILDDGYDPGLFSFSLELCDGPLLRQLAGALVENFSYAEKFSTRTVCIIRDVLAIFKTRFDSNLDDIYAQLVIMYLKSIREAKREEKRNSPTSLAVLGFDESIVGLTNSVETFLQLASLALNPPGSYLMQLRQSKLRKNALDHKMDEETKGVETNNNADSTVRKKKGPTLFERCFTIRSIICWWNYAYSVSSIEEADLLFQNLQSIAEVEQDLNGASGGRVVSEELVVAGLNICATLLKHLDTLIYDVESFAGSQSVEQSVGKSRFLEAYQHLPVLLNSLLCFLSYLVESSESTVMILLDWKSNYRASESQKANNGVGNYLVPDCFLLLVDRLMFGVLLRESEFPPPVEATLQSKRTKFPLPSEESETVEKNLLRSNMFQSLTLAVQLVTQNLLNFSQEQIVERGYDLQSLVKWIYHQYFEILFYMEELFAKNYSNACFHFCLDLTCLTL